MASALVVLGPSDGVVDEDGPPVHPAHGASEHRVLAAMRSASTDAAAVSSPRHSRSVAGPGTELVLTRGQPSRGTASPAAALRDALLLDCPPVRQVATACMLMDDNGLAAALTGGLHARPAASSFVHAASRVPVTADEACIMPLSDVAMAPLAAADRSSAPASLPSASPSALDLMASLLHLASEVVARDAEPPVERRASSLAAPVGAADANGLGDRSPPAAPPGFTPAPHHSTEGGSVTSVLRHAAPDSRTIAHQDEPRPAGDATMARGTPPAPRLGAQQRAAVAAYHSCELPFMLGACSRGPYLLGDPTGRGVVVGHQDPAAAYLCEPASGESLPPSPFLPTIRHVAALRTSSLPLEAVCSGLEGGARWD